MGLQGILFYFIAALFYFILFYMCGRLKIGSHIGAFDWYRPRWPWVTLNGVIALILRFSLNSIALLANYVTVVEDRPIMSAEYCTPVPVFHFWPKLSHPAARSPCDSWATC